MDLPMEVNDDQVQQTEAMEASPRPLDLSVKKRKRSDSETATENDDKPDDTPKPVAEDDGTSSSLEADDEKPTTPLDLSRNNKPATPPIATGTGNKSCNVVRPSVVVRSPTATVTPTLQKVYQAPVASPLIADHVSPLSHLAAQPDAANVSYEHVFSEYNTFLAAAAAAGAVAKPPLAPLPPARPSAAQFHHHHHHHLHQQQQQQHRFYLQQQQQLHLQQQHQLQLQIQQLQQQQQLATYGHPYDLNPMMMTKHNMVSPLYAATSSPSSSESNQFPFCGFDYLPRSAYNFGYPYFDEILDTKGVAGDYSGGDGGLDSSSIDRSDCMSPESTTPMTDHRRRSSKMLDDPDVDPEEIAAIYRQSDFVAFRNRYLESLGPPKNFEKMRRSVPNKKLQMNGQHLYDQTYVMKRQKNNEAAKRSRDAKRQKYIENQISVMYLTKKVSEMKEIKRRLLMSM